MRLSRLLLVLALAVAFFDLCFWNVDSFGLSLGVFYLALAAAILFSRESRSGRLTIFMLVLLTGAALAAAIETGITNFFVLFSLTIALAGETYFRGIQTAWGRWLSQVVALVFAPGRVLWLGARLLEAGTRGGVAWTGGLLGGCLLALPALILALLFGALLSAGNAVFGSWTTTFFDWFWKELALYLDPARIFFWVVGAFCILPLLRPAQVSALWWKWTESLPRFPEVIPARGAVFSSGMILVVLNVLFLVANVADAMFLWSGHALPAGVNPKDYVHEGVEALITTVILSAVVLTAIFQQEIKVARRTELKILAYLWVAQNLVLIFSVTEKMRRYIVEYEMTVARLSTIIFLILVLVGFILLTIKIVQDRSISWLIGGCVLAVFASFYITQFLDLAGWSANYNIGRWEQDRGHLFDSKTMCIWGPDVWPALRRAHDLAPDNPDISASWQQQLDSPAYKEHSQVTWQHWREFSLRAYWNRSALEENSNK